MVDLMMLLLVIGTYLIGYKDGQRNPPKLDLEDTPPASQEKTND